MTKQAQPATNPVSPVSSADQDAMVAKWAKRFAPDSEAGESDEDVYETRVIEVKQSESCPASLRQRTQIVDRRTGEIVGESS